MTETLLAFVALSLVVLFTFSQQRAIVESEREMAGIEFEVMASAVGSERMLFIATKDFDQYTRDGTITPQNDNANLLTAPAAFGINRPCGGAGNACTDIDDFHLMEPDTVFFATGESAGGGTVGFRFLLTAEVSYVDDSGQETSSRTWTKEVTLRVDQYAAEGEPRYLLEPIVLKRRFSPLW